MVQAIFVFLCELSRRNECFFVQSAVMRRAGGDSSVRLLIVRRIDRLRVEFAKNASVLKHSGGAESEYFDVIWPPPATADSVAPNVSVFAEKRCPSVQNGFRLLLLTPLKQRP